MRSIWHRTSTGRRVLIFIVAACLAAGLTFTAAAWLGTEHGSPDFDAMMVWGRVLLQLAAGIGVVALLAISSRAGKHD